MGIRLQILKTADRFVIGFTELAKALVRESFRLGQQLTDSASAAILQVVNNDAYYAARRNRIHPGPEIVPKLPDRKMSNFGYVLLASSQDYDETWDSPNYRNVSFTTRTESPAAKANERYDAISETTVATENSLPQKVIGAVKAFGRWLVNRIVSILHLFLMWIPGMGSRAERLALMLGREELTGREFEIDHEHTGLLEDVQTRLHMWLEWCCWVVRRCLYMLLGSRSDQEVADLLSRNLTLRDFRSHTLRRNQNFDAIVRRAGYPFEKILVNTDDGYQLELHRLPKPESNRVMFLQHGIMDSSYSFVAKGASDGLAFRAFDKGYDVFMGNFRGTSALKHRSDDISARDYWDFTLDDHGNFDIDAFVKEICRVKDRDLAQKPSLQPDVTLVAHSMGAAASLIYAVNKRRLGKAHNLSRMVLMSPAGYHQRIPRFCRYFGPILDSTLSQWTYTLSVPSDAARQLSSKLVTDAVGLPALRDVIYSIGEMFLGGDFKSTLHPHVKTVTENMVAGTSSKVFRQFWRCYTSGRFLSYDHGPEGNLKAYGTETPVDYLSHYNLIDIPIHFMAGQNDKLIPPKDCVKHYKTLMRFSPSLATCKPFEGRGHIDFTYGLDQEITNEIFAHAAPPRSHTAAPADAISPNSSAARSAVVHVGDQITSVDKAVVVGQTPEQVMRVMSGPEGSVVTVGFTRNGAHKKAALTLDCV